MNNRLVTIPPVKCFPDVELSKAQALKPLGEAAEVFGAWQECNETSDLGCDGNCRSCVFGTRIINECADVIQATCNLLSAIGVEDMTGAMYRCEMRNRERGRYGDQDTTKAPTSSDKLRQDTKCDREALLELADVMEGKVDDFDATVGDVPVVRAGYLTAYAECIREACGVE